MLAPYEEDRNPGANRDNRLEKSKYLPATVKVPAAALYEDGEIRRILPCHGIAGAGGLRESKRLAGSIFLESFAKIQLFEGSPRNRGIKSPLFLTPFGGERISQTSLERAL